ELGAEVRVHADGARELPVASTLERVLEAVEVTLPLHVPAQELQAEGGGLRSEERRVGKECRARWGPVDYKRQTGQERTEHIRVSALLEIFFFKQKTAYEIFT